MSATRMMHRKRWRGDCPPQFDRASQERAAYRRGVQLPERIGFQEWLATVKPQGDAVRT